MFSVTRSEHGIACRMSAELANIDRASEETSNLLQRHSLEACSFAVLLGMREALSNAVLHGSGANPEKSVHYALELHDGTIILRVQDEGEGFAWRDAACQVPEPSSTRGRGMAILHRYFDEVAYNEPGNVIVLTKHFQKGACMSDIQNTGNAAVVKPGRDIVSSMANEFKSELKGLVDQGVKELTMDLNGVEMIDSIGMGLLIAAHNSLVKAGGKLRVINPTQDILGLMRTMRLDKHFEVVA